MGRPLQLNPHQDPIVVPNATQQAAGAMSPEDKLKLDTMTSPQPSNATPQPLGTADPGVSDDYSRSDHVHPLSTGGTTSVVGTEAVAIGQLVEVDIAYLTANNALRYRVWRHTGGSPSIAGSAVTACSGAGASFTIAVGNAVPLVNLVTDGTVTISPGDPVGPSNSVDGAILGGGVPYLGVCVSNVSIGHTPGATVPTWRTII